MTDDTLQKVIKVSGTKKIPAIEEVYGLIERYHYLFSEGYVVVVSPEGEISIERLERLDKVSTDDTNIRLD